MKRIAAIVVCAFLVSPALAQHQPYSGMEQRAVKALSDKQIEDLRNGRGMGLAMAAELNGYPGPLHVLEHADALGLSAEQRAKTKQLFESMKAETIPLGEKLIAEETDLDRAFAHRRISLDNLAAKTNLIGQTQAELRAAHLRYHLAQVELLSPAQVSRYIELRGYAGHHGPQKHTPRH